ncbi:MAG: helix-turn-helix domain-containing protein [Gammaproteobacteria bacterium]|nr:MAG: helix-turn-helix domain-containing protein [Gammaproteobacteria bacterium]
MAPKSLKKKGSRRTQPQPSRRVQDVTPANQLEIAIGQQVRAFRMQLHMTVAEVASQADLSPGMLSKIENGLTSPSLATLKALSGALNVPVTAFFRKYEEERDASFVKAGQGLNIERRGTRAGHQYQLLGHTVGKQMFVEPYLISITEKSDVFPLFQHDGVEFIHMLSGEVIYRHAGQTYRLTPGDSLFFDADAPHGPEELVTLPIRFLAIIIEPRGS